MSAGFCATFSDTYTHRNHTHLNLHLQVERCYRASLAHANGLERGCHAQQHTQEGTSIPNVSAHYTRPLSVALSAGICEGCSGTHVCCFETERTYAIDKHLVKWGYAHKGHAGGWYPQQLPLSTPQLQHIAPCL